jgi:hypothetical protein
MLIINVIGSIHLTAQRSANLCFGWRKPCEYKGRNAQKSRVKNFVRQIHCHSFQDCIWNKESEDCRVLSLLRATKAQHDQHEVQRLVLLLENDRMLYR